MVQGKGPTSFFFLLVTAYLVVQARFFAKTILSPIEWFWRPCCAVAHACNPSTLGGQAGGSRGQGFKTSLANTVKPRLY